MTVGRLPDFELRLPPQLVLEALELLRAQVDVELVDLHSMTRRPLPRRRRVRPILPRPRRARRKPRRIRAAEVPAPAPVAPSRQRRPREVPPVRESAPPGRALEAAPAAVVDQPAPELSQLKVPAEFPANCPLCNTPCSTEARMRRHLDIVHNRRAA